MKKILIGAFFVFFSFNIPLGDGFGSFGLAPDFVGYILMLVGTNELMKKEQSAFPVLRSVDIILKALIIASAVDYGLDLFGVSLVASSVEGFFWIVLLMAGDVYCWKKVVDAIGRIEKESRKDLNTEHLTTAWWIHMIAGVLSVAGTWVTEPILYCIIIGLVISAPIYFLVQLYKTNKAYQALARK